MENILDLIKNYGNSCEWVGYHRIIGVSESDSVRARWEKQRDEDFAKIQRHLTSQSSGREKGNVEIDYKAKYEEALKLLEEAYNHLDYCGYGDSWERECSEELARKLDIYFS